MNKYNTERKVAQDFFFLYFRYKDVVLVGSDCRIRSPRVRGEVVGIENC